MSGRDFHRRHFTHFDAMQHVEQPDVDVGGEIPRGL
jgi:hypothetical protein